MPEEMTLAYLDKLTEEQKRLDKLAEEQNRKQHEEMQALFNDPYERGYAAGYARAQRDIRMALGCKQ